MTTGSRIHDSLLGDPDVAAHFSSHNQLQTMLDVESALAHAQASVGVVPNSCVHPIRSAARAELYDCGQLATETAASGNPVIPVVHHLTATVAANAPAAARYVHWGATSQDILDTSLVLQMRAAIPTVLNHLQRNIQASAALARRFADATMAGRTWLQQATPITFGLKAAGWADALNRTRQHLQTALDDALVLQFGGAAGTLASLGSQGLAVTNALADHLELRTAAIPWHAHRDRFAQLACALGVTTGVIGKIARDLALLSQTEVAEVCEQPVMGRGGSSTMPQKHNPVGASVALAAAGRTPGLVATLLAAMVQEHERAIGGWQVEWDTLPDVVLASAGGARAMADTLEHLSVDTRRMRANLDASGGTLLAESIAMTLAESIGKHEAHTCIEAACRLAHSQGRTLAEVLTDDPTVTRHLSRSEIARLLSPDQYLGVSRQLIQRVLHNIQDTSQNDD